MTSRLILFASNQARLLHIIDVLLDWRSPSRFIVFTKALIYSMGIESNNTVHQAQNLLTIESDQLQK